MLHLSDPMWASLLEHYWVSTGEATGRIWSHLEPLRWQFPHPFSGWHLPLRCKELHQWLTKLPTVNQQQIKSHSVNYSRECLIWKHHTGRSHCLDCHSLRSPPWWFPSPYSSASWVSDCASTLIGMEDTEMLANLKTFGVCLVLKVNSNGFSFFFTKEADNSFYDAVDFLNVLDFLLRIPLFKYDT